jgi:hypothetical protein
MEDGARMLCAPYQPIRQPQSIADRQLEIEFLDPSAEAFSLTFD